MDKKKNPGEDGEEVLTYTIHKYSSSSSTYVPTHILEDKPKDQSSRWSSNTISPPQYLLLKLERPALVKSILFGKYEKTHVCNLKKFKIFGGIREEDNFVELLDSGLKNDSVPETFGLRYIVNKHPYPCRYIKIVPLQSWGPIFNFSIWHVSLRGQSKPAIVNPAVVWQEQFRENEALRLCLKHFRHRNYSEIFESLQKRTRIQLESQLLTNLHEALVSQGNFALTESIISQSIEDGLFDPWINSQRPHPQWTPLVITEDPSPPSMEQSSVVGAPGSTPFRTPTPENEIPDEYDEEEDQNNASLGGTAGNPQTSVAPYINPLQPQPRGGHQMVMDTAHQCIYLFGGWDGTRDLSDFWVIDVTSSGKKWKLLSLGTERDGGPTPRSCHKMVLDQSSRHIFVLGRYLERELRDDEDNIKSDFYMYNLDTQRWALITDDTAAMGGPSLTFDHQMALDQENRTIYVFGGQSLCSASSFQGSGNEARYLSSIYGDKRYSGLYSYHIPTNTWRKIREDNNGSALQPGPGEIFSRSSHSMLFHAGKRKLYIFGGQRKKDDYLNDFFTYDVDNDEIEIISSGNSTDSSIPAVGHTTRATIDCQRNEIHVMMGLNKDKSQDHKRGNSSSSLESNKVISSFWMYNITLNVWTCLYKNENGNESGEGKKKQQIEPRPRYAHQLVYNENTKIHYMFGGNPGGREGKEDKVRLGDFWSLFFIRPSKEEVFERCKLMIRKVQFLELANEEREPLVAMSFLQTRLAEVVNHDNTEEERDFQLLASQLFQVDQCNSSESRGTVSPKYCDSRRDRRSDLFDQLSELFPHEMAQPRGNLVDLIRHEVEHS